MTRVHSPVLKSRVHTTTLKSLERPELPRKQPTPLRRSLRNSPSASFVGSPLLLVRSFAFQVPYRAWCRLLPTEGVGTVLRTFPPPTSWLPTPFPRGVMGQSFVRPLVITKRNRNANYNSKRFEQGFLSHSYRLRNDKKCQQNRSR